MKKLIKAISLSLILVGAVFAQNENDDYKRNEFFVGYTNQQVNDFQRQSLNGFEVAVVRNFHRYIGVKGDLSAAYRKRNQPEVFTGGSKTIIPDPSQRITGDYERSLYNFLGGVQIKNNSSKARIKPFVHALAGVGVEQNSAKNVVCAGNCAEFNSGINSFTNSNTEVGFSRAFGGGLDVKLNDKIDVRAFQIDYNPIYKEKHLNNVRMSFGFVF